MQLSKNNKKDLKEIGVKLAMHIAAQSPIAIDESGIKKEILDKELEIIKEELKNTGKKTDMIEKISGEKSFYWKGKYNSNFKTRDTLITELNALEKFNPVVKDSSKNAEIVVLGNLPRNL